MAAFMGLGAKEFDSQAKQACKNKTKPQEDYIAAGIVEVGAGDSCSKRGGKDAQGTELECAVDVHVDGIWCVMRVCCAESR